MDADDLLQAYSRAVMHDLRKSTTTSTGELEDYARRHFLPHECLGVFPADVTPARMPLFTTWYALIPGIILFLTGGIRAGPYAPSQISDLCVRRRACGRWPG